MLAVLGAAGCTEKKVASDDPSVQVVEVALSDVGCEPNSHERQGRGHDLRRVQRGLVRGVTEFELMTEDKGRVLGEAENVGPGLESSFSLNLDGRQLHDLLPRRLQGVRHPRGGRGRHRPDR